MKKTKAVRGKTTKMNDRKTKPANKTGLTSEGNIARRNK